MEDPVVDIYNYMPEMSHIIPPDTSSNTMKIKDVVGYTHDKKRKCALVTCDNSTLTPVSSGEAKIQIVKCAHGHIVKEVKCRM